MNNEYIHSHYKVNFVAELYQKAVSVTLLVSVIIVIIITTFKAFSFVNSCSFVVPVEAVVLIVWWGVDLVRKDAGDGENWYDFGRETLVMTLTQVTNRQM